MKKNITNKYHNYEYFSSSDNIPKINVNFKQTSGEKCNECNVVVIEVDKSVKYLLQKYLAKIGRESDYFLERYIFLYNSKNLLKDQDENIAKIFGGSSNVTVTIYDNLDIKCAGCTPFPFDFVDVTSNKIKLKKVTFDGRPDKTHRKVYPN